MRKMKHIVRATGELTRKHGDDLNDTDSMYNVLITHLMPAMTAADVEIFMGMLKEHFPDSKSPVFEEDATKLAFYTLQSKDISAEKCLQVWHQAQVRHGLCIFGEMEKCWTTLKAVVKSDNGTTSEINAEGMSEEKFTTKLTSVLKNPAKNYWNHWIVI